MFDFILPFDLSVAGAADKLRFSCGRFLTPVMKAITLSGNMGMIFVVSAFVMLFFKKTRRFGVAALIAIALGFLFTNVILKHVIARERPFENVSSKFYTYWKAAGALNESGYSFPSGHTTAATAFGVSLFLHTKKVPTYKKTLFVAVSGDSRGDGLYPHIFRRALCFGYPGRLYRGKRCRRNRLFYRRRR